MTTAPIVADSPTYPTQKRALRGVGPMRILAGQYFDSETGLHYWGARYYDPKTGRGISADRMSVAEHVARWQANLGTPNQPPLELNPYVAVANNPLKYVDPTGEAAIPGAIYGAIAGGVSGYISSGGTWKGAGIGALAGGAVGAVNPFSSHIVGAAAGGVVSSVAGQVAANAIDPCKKPFDINYELALVSGLGGGAGRGLVNYLNTPTRSATAFILNRGLGAGNQVANQITSSYVRGGLSGFAQYGYKEAFLPSTREQQCSCQAR